jgi:hypothetical protein
VHTTTGVFVVLDDQLVFPYCGYSGDAGDGRSDMYGGGAIGLALRSWPQDRGSHAGRRSVRSAMSIVFRLQKTDFPSPIRHHRTGRSGRVRRGWHRSRGHGHR